MVVDIKTSSMSMVGTLLGGAALGWNVYNYRQTALGYMKLKLKCNYPQPTPTEKYITCKTSIENTGRKPIDVYYSFLLLVSYPSTYEEIMRRIYVRLVERIDDKQGFELKKLFPNLAKSVPDLQGRCYHSKGIAVLLYI